MSHTKTSMQHWLTDEGLLEAAKLCYAAYGQNSDEVTAAISSLPHWNLKHLWVTSSFEACLFEGENIDFISIRGSDDIRDWAHNLDLQLTPISSSRIEVHRGFLTGAKMLTPSIVSNISPTKPTLMAGHSLGGAIAQVILALLHIEAPGQFNIPGLITFGAPKPGGKQFSEFWNFLEMFHIRCICGEDQVPNTPFHWMGYQHTNSTIVPIQPKPSPRPRGIIDTWLDMLPEWIREHIKVRSMLKNTIGLSDHRIASTLNSLTT